MGKHVNWQTSEIMEELNLKQDLTVQASMHSKWVRLFV